MSADKTVTRYGDEELQEFKVVLETKMATAQQQLDRLQEQIQETSENGSDEHGGDWVDDSGYNTDLEMLQTMAVRQLKYIQDLQAALLRIRNKTYGICANTGLLIDKKRLLAVPTTTKSLAAKGEEQKEMEKKSKIREVTKMPYIKKERKVITKVVKKSSSTSPSTREEEYDEDDDYFDDDTDDMTETNDHVDIDDIADTLSDD